jgi:hypothetical protein
MNNEDNNEEVLLPNLPIKIDNINIDIPSLQNPNDNRPDIGTSSLPIEFNLKEPVKKPGWFEQAGHELFKMNRLALAGEFIADRFNDSSTVDEVEEGFTALKKEYLEGFPEQYYGYISSAKSPNDVAARQQKAREQMEEDERFADGSFTATLLGGFAGVLSDPSTYLFPLAVGGKYASIAQNVFLNMERTAGGLAIDSVSRNMLIQANRIGGNVQDMATDSLRDFMFSTALVGIGGAVGGGLRESKLWNTRKFFNFGADGINVSPVVNEEGIIVKEMHARAMPGNNVSAAQVDAANLYIDEVMHMGGLFAVPVIGQSLQKALGWGFLATPAMKAMNSSNPALKSFFNRITSHGIITKGEEEGRVRETTADEYASFYKDEARNIGNSIRDLYLEANGISSNSKVKNAIVNYKQQYSKTQTITEEQFGIEIRNAATIEGYKSEFDEVHKAADLAINFFEKMGFDYHASVGKGDIFLNPRNAIKYMPQNWNIPAMLDKPEVWKELTNTRLAEQENTIRQLQQPINDIDNLIHQTKQHLKTIKESGADISIINNLKEQINQHELQKFKLENQLNNHILDTPDLHILLEDRVLLNEQEREQLIKLHEPLRMAESKKVLIESRIKPLKAEIKQRPKDESIKTKLLKAEEELALAKKEIDNQYELIQRKAREGEIDKKLYNLEGDEYKFLDPHKKPKFRNLFESDYHREQYVQQAYDAILNQTPDDLLHGVFGTLEPGLIENPQYLKQRNLLFDTTEHNNKGFLDSNISKTLGSYASTMGKIIGFKRAFPEFSESKGMDGVLGMFHRDSAKRRIEIEKKPPSKERTKELTKFQKDNAKDIQFMQDTYKVYMGTYSSRKPSTFRLTGTLKSLVASAKLGAVPIYQLAELGAIVLKQGIMPFFAAGLRPMIQGLNGHIKTIESEERRLNAANAHLALWTMRNSYADNLVNSSSQSYVKITSISEKVGIAADNLAHVSGNLFGINYIANANETTAANIFQSSVMQAAFAHEAGTITKKQISNMARYGIDIKKESKRFIQNYKDADGYEMYGAHYSRYYKWADSEASNIMSMAMRRMVKDTVVNADRFASPYWTQDPFLSMIFMFHGWAYGALTHYAIPMMQRPDAEHMLGMLMTVGLSMAADPLKRIANGKEPYDNDSTWYEEVYKGISYSGLLGPYADWFDDINVGTGSHILPGLVREKTKFRSPGIAGSGGPVIGWINDLGKSAGHLLANDWTVNDAKRAYRLAPLSSFLPLRNISNKWIESMGLPEKRNATGSDPNLWASPKF